MLDKGQILQLKNDGYLVAPGPFAGRSLQALSSAYDAAVSAAGPSNLHRGATSLRIGDLVNGHPSFELIYTHAPLLAAAAALIGASFKLSAFHARTVLPHADAQDLHQDFPRLPDGWPMVGFILMVDDFRADNGATRFVAGSQQLRELPAGRQSQALPACGPAGSMIIHNGAVWHGHGANGTNEPRRSIQGALIRRDQPSAIDHQALTSAATRARLGRVALELLDL
jgi:ectoine hydroxylase-related dioxygenase (phytanoyl-CoA dioxygenase family)